MRRVARHCIALFALSPLAAMGAAPPGDGARDYAALAKLPAWEGSWNLGDAPRRGPPFEAGPLKPEMLVLMQRSMADELPADPRRYCRPAEFAGLSGGIIDNIEFLFTPGRVTLLNESGLVRRIYTDGRPMPDDPEPSKAGTSIGHWEGQTLVVETRGLHPANVYLSTSVDAIRIGRDARIMERITLLDAQRLEFNVTIVAPDLLTGPAERKFFYTRAPRDYVQREVVFCTDDDRSIDPETGRQRFDMTAPPDLPPPPAR